MKGCHSLNIFIQRTGRVPASIQQINWPRFLYRTVCSYHKEPLFRTGETHTNTRANTGLTNSHAVHVYRSSPETGRRILVVLRCKAWTVLVLVMITSNGNHEAPSLAIDTRHSSVVDPVRESTLSVLGPNEAANGRLGTSPLLVLGIYRNWWRTRRSSERQVGKDHTNLRHFETVTERRVGLTVFTVVA